MAKSIMQIERECYLTGRTDNLHKHHVFGGPNRKISEANGFWCYLTADKHNMAVDSVHHNRALDLLVKTDCQQKFEEAHTREEFMRLIGRNYL